GFAEQPYRAAMRLLQAGQNPQQAGFADAAGAKNAHHLAGLEVQLEVLQHIAPGCALAVAEGDVLCLQYRCGHAEANRFSSVRNCARLGVITGTKADSRRRRAKPSPWACR